MPQEDGAVGLGPKGTLDGVAHNPDRRYSFRVLCIAQLVGRGMSKMFPEVSHALSKQQLVAIAEKQSGEESYEKDGCTWVGWLGFKFNSNGELVFVSPSWSSSEKDPCYSASE